MILGRTSTPSTSSTHVRDAPQTANREEVAAHLHAAARITEHCQRQYVEMHGFLQQLQEHLEGVHILSTQNIVPANQVNNTLQVRDIEMATLQKELEESKRERMKLASELAERDRALRRVTQERDGLSKLLANRTAELDAAQAFLPATDSVTDTHTIGLVEALNYEISQAATSLAEWLDGEARQLPISRKLAAEFGPTIRRVGKPIANILSSLGEDPMLSLQIGLQAFLTHISKMEINCWNHRGRFSLDVMLDSAKDAMKKNEPEHIAVRWSALTHKYVQVALERDLKSEEIAAQLAHQCAKAVTFAGFCSDMSTSETEKLVMGRTGPQLLELSKIVLDLNKIFGQKVLRGWMYCIGARAGEAYDPVTMDMDFQGEDEVADAKKYRVIGVTALGLQRTEGEEDVTLLKSKVAVERTLAKA